MRATDLQKTGVFKSKNFVYKYVLAYYAKTDARQSVIVETIMVKIAIVGKAMVEKLLLKYRLLGRQLLK